MNPSRIIAFFCILFTVDSFAFQQPFLSMGEMIAESKLIFEGIVTHVHVRRNVKDFIVTDCQFQITRVLFGQHDKNQITLTFAGGVLGEERVSISGVPRCVKGEQGIYLVEDSTEPHWSPLAGSFQGRLIKGDSSVSPFTHATEEQAKPAAVIQNDGIVIYNFESFVQQLDNEIREVKYPSKQSFKPQGESDTDILLDALASPLPPTIEIAGHSNVIRPPDAPVEYFCYSDGTPRYQRLCQEFRKHLDYWNQYANIFKYGGEVNQFEDKNARNEFVGYMTHEKLYSQYGYSLPPKMLGITIERGFMKEDEFIKERDIFLNATEKFIFSPTESYQALAGGELKFDVSRIIRHELGHGWGLDHQHELLSVMSYQNKKNLKYWAFPQLFVEDIIPLVETFPKQVVKIMNDLGISLFYSAGQMDYRDSTLTPQKAKPGETIKIEKVIVENLGQMTKTPKIRWYLVNKMFEHPSKKMGIYIKTTKHRRLASLKKDDLSVNLDIPLSVPRGQYFIAAWLDKDAVSANNTAWLSTPLNIE